MDGSFYCSLFCLFPQTLFSLHLGFFSRKLKLPGSLHLRAILLPFTEDFKIDTETGTGTAQKHLGLSYRKRGWGTAGVHRGHHSGGHHTESHRGESHWAEPHGVGKCDGTGSVLEFQFLKQPTLPGRIIAQSTKTSGLCEGGTHFPLTQIKRKATKPL